jgi:cation diffusion facilitator CzcD-associated flavoprotein CzcO
MSSKNHSKYIIVGSGIAGLTAAVKLKEQNLDYLILEKQNRIAGTWKSLF